MVRISTFDSACASFTVIRLCTKTPAAGGRVFEVGDEKLLQLAHKTQIPVVIVFTQYDRLVRTKQRELKEQHHNMDSTTLDKHSMDEARKAFEICVQSLRLTMERLHIPMPHYVKVSVRPGYKEDVSALVEVTQDIVKERLKEDAWIMWAIAQRASLPVKIEACITKGMSCM
jgi:GTPase SAR1 family protein